jgi:hypothetical protein
VLQQHKPAAIPVQYPSIQNSFPRSVLWATNDEQITATGPRLGETVYDQKPMLFSKVCGAKVRIAMMSWIVLNNYLQH